MRDKDVLESAGMTILIIRPGALGDTLMLAPALAEMRGREDMILVARRPALDILRPLVREGMDYEGGGWHRLFMDDLYVMEGLQQIDLTVAFLSDRSGKSRDHLQAFMPGSSVHVFPPFPQETERVHAAFHLARCLESSGCAVNPARALAEAAGRPLLGIDTIPLCDSKRGVVFHPGSGGPLKNHPGEFCEALLRELRDALSNKVPLVILLGPAEESSLSFYRERLPGDGVEIIFSPETEPLLRLLKSARLYLGHDSGVTHLAAMMGTPTVALFRNSSLDLWKPLGPRVTVIQGEGGPGLIGQICRTARDLAL